MSKKNETIEELENVDLDESLLDLEDFDSAEFLNTPEAVAAYLQSAFASGDMEHFKEAMKTARRAEKMDKFAKAAGLTREGVYKALRKGTEPKMQTIVGLLDALGMAFQIVPKETLASDNRYALAA